ncbi:MAG: hypothetical protein UV67_C0001G0035 [Parcubacteria group bacterium GW2011_GWC1_43_12]|nr:MAG: hypothetical protein UV34_C0011G0013 [Parcubacteria group bacterium GW2011_GWB1_42_6]KKS92595.1 MAG: hypothetical protein UV67_C0001G0035 [Parcubacteria group bacterium GW2011_GWC1_43_12]
MKAKFEEKRKELAMGVAEFHQRLERESPIIELEKKEILRKYPNRPFPWADPAEYMSLEDTEKYRMLEQKTRNLDCEGKRFAYEVFVLFSEDKSVKWKREFLEGAAPNSLAQTNSREYKARLDDNYHLSLKWFDYPNDEVEIGKPETYRESFSISLSGKRKIKILVLKRSLFGNSKMVERLEEDDFHSPILGISEQEDHRFQTGKSEEDVLNEEEREKFKSLLLSFGRKLREEIG